METNGHTFIDVLKIDIEGAEFDSFSKFVDDWTTVDAVTGRNHTILPVGQLQLEIHAREWSGFGDFLHFNQWWEKLEAAGLRPFWTEANLVYVNIFKTVRPDLVEVRWNAYRDMPKLTTHFLIYTVFIPEYQRRPRVGIGQVQLIISS